ncbi:unnamed protein product, partial [Ectocarpus sp. 6 AP-2014]
APSWLARERQRRRQRHRSVSVPPQGVSGRTAEAGRTLHHLSEGHPYPCRRCRQRRGQERQGCVEGALRWRGPAEAGAAYAGRHARG